MKTMLTCAFLGLLLLSAILVCGSGGLYGDGGGGVTLAPSHTLSLNIACPASSPTPNADRRVTLFDPEDDEEEEFTSEPATISSEYAISTSGFRERWLDHLGSPSTSCIAAKNASRFDELYRLTGPSPVA